MATPFLNALDCTPHTGIPFWELEFHLWNTFSSIPFYCGEDFLSLSTSEKERALHTNADNMAEVSYKLHFSAVTVPGGYWELAPGHAAYFWLPEEYRYRQVEILKKSMPDSINLVANTGGVMSMPDADNYMTFAYRIFEDPESVDAQAERTLQEGLDRVKIFADLGVNVMLTASDLADNSGPFFAPDQMERFILPQMSQWAEVVKRSGAKSILHTDGNITLYLEQLISTGINAIQAIDPVAGMDLIESLDKVKNRICLIGNLDCGLLLTGMPEDVYKATLKMIHKACRYPGYILGTSNAVQPEVLKENYESMVRAVEEMRD